MSVYNGTLPIVTDGLVLYLDVANPKSYSGTGNTLSDLYGDVILSNIETNTNYSSNSFVFTNISSGITVNETIPNGNLSIEYVIFNSNENGINRYVINSNSTEIKTYGNTNVFYFLRKTNDISASFGDSLISGYTGISFEVDLNTYNFITISHNVDTGIFKVYKKGVLYKTTDGFYNRTTGQSTGYSGLVSNSNSFKLGQ